MSEYKDGKAIKRPHDGSDIIAQDSSGNMWKEKKFRRVSAGDESAQKKQSSQDGRYGDGAQLVTSHAVPIFGREDRDAPTSTSRPSPPQPENVSDCDTASPPSKKQGGESSGESSDSQNISEPKTPPQPLFSQDSLDSCIATEMSSWRLLVGSVSLLHILQARVERVDIRTGPAADPSKAFFDLMGNVSFKMDGETQSYLKKFINDLSNAMVFDVPDYPPKNVTKEDCRPLKLYDGYSADDEMRPRMMEDLQISHEKVLHLLRKYKRVDDGKEDIYLKLIGAAFNFISLTTHFLRHPAIQAKSAYEALFKSFASLVGLEFCDGSIVSARKMKIYGKEVHGKVDLRSFMHCPSIQWCNGGAPRDVAKVMTLPVTSVAEVKVHAVNTKDPRRHLDYCLAQLLAEMLGELRSNRARNVGQSVDNNHQEIVGLAVMSTRVQFVLLKLSRDVASLYDNQPDQCFEDEDRTKAVVYVTDWLDFMKVRHRPTLLSMMHKISIMSNRDVL